MHSVLMQFHTTRRWCVLCLKQRRTLGKLLHCYPDISIWVIAAFGLVRPSGMMPSGFKFLKQWPTNSEIYQ
jgi:hypothetical protein